MARLGGDLRRFCAVYCFQFLPIRGGREITGNAFVTPGFQLYFQYAPANGNCMQTAARRRV